MSFAENNFHEGAFKGSLYKALFGQRKGLLEGYPAAKKGLVFPEPCLKFGAANYTFKTNDVCDKVTAKHNDVEFSARWKKTTKAWDLSYKQQFCKPCAGLLKYEERGEGSPTLVAGLNGVQGDLAWNVKAKQDFSTIKGSAMYDLGGFVKGLKLAADCKQLGLTNFESLAFNAGLAYGSPAGTTVVGYSSKQVLTLLHSMDLTKEASLAIEIAQPTNKKTIVSVPMTVGVGYQLDSDHQLRVRVNNKAEVNASLKKTLSPNLSLLASTVVSLQDGKALSKVPSFGFKVVTK